MRIYMNATEAMEEIRRDLMEMGITVKPKTYQDKIIEGNPDFYTRELQNYCYTILDASSDSIPNVVQPWANHEFSERVHDAFVMSTVGNFINPGTAYKDREDVWNEFLEANGLFGYTYNERIWQNDQLTKLIRLLQKDPDTRQAWLSLWNPMIDPNNVGGVHRVPCSLGYNFQVREGKLHIHYVMRSSDFSTHFANDVFLAIRLQEYVAAHLDLPVGNFTHTMFSLHVYQKDVKEVF